MSDYSILKDFVPLVAAGSAVVIAILSFIFSYWSNKQRARLELELKLHALQLDARAKAASDKAIFLRSENMKYREYLQIAISSLQSLKDIISLVVNNNSSPQSFDSETIKTRLGRATELVAASHSNLLSIGEKTIIPYLHKLKRSAQEVEFDVRKAIGQAEFVPSLDNGLCQKLASVRSEVNDVQIQIRDELLVLTSRLLEETFEYAPRPLDR